MEAFTLGLETSICEIGRFGFCFPDLELRFLQYNGQKTQNYNSNSQRT